MPNKSEVFLSLFVVFAPHLGNMKNLVPTHPVVLFSLRCGWRGDNCIRGRASATRGAILGADGTMAAKVPTAEEVLALVAAASASNGAVEPTMRQLLLQVQAQAQVHAQAQMQAQVHAQAQMQAQQALGKSMKPETTPGASVATSSDAAAAAVAAANAVVNGQQPGAASMDLLPLSAAAVVVASPTNGGPVTPGDDSNSANPPLKRKSIPLSMKKEAIEWILGPGKGIPSRAEKHFSALNWDVSASSFRKWWKNREKILGDSSNKKRITGGGRKPYLEDSEEKLLVIVIQERAKKDRVTRKWIAKTAQHMFQRTNANFKASENWVTKFIRRNGLTLKRSYVTYEQPDGENGGAALELAQADTEMEDVESEHNDAVVAAAVAAAEARDDDTKT